ncbi:hypothetical protein HNQ57_000636 [Zhongshania antarctica]|uniref:Uncharacterized protein n=1 Tax=Zhongshania antarctica TaxID=641702 RepID=A0A840R047_9GAMM|nr:hypothetical protein [Zhongshania antarctica]
MAVISWFYVNGWAPLSVMSVAILKMNAGYAPWGVGGEA